MSTPPRPPTHPPTQTHVPSSRNLTPTHARAHRPPLPTEYFGERETWPVPEAQTAADTFGRLKDITSPLLLMHGKDDDICTATSALFFTVSHAFLQLYATPAGAV